jgi:tryptophan-rich sensory protein
LVAFAAAAVGAVASVDAASFYAQLVKPSWAPPAWLFGPVWSALYALMGVAAWLVWRSPGSRRVALGVFGVQLAANALWSWLFFAWHRGALAAVEVLVLLALIVATIKAFSRISRVSALLLVPYLLWVSFASVLTWAVWRANPGLL